MDYGAECIEDLKELDKDDIESLNFKPLETKKLIREIEKLSGNHLLSDEKVVQQSVEGNWECKVCFNGNMDTILMPCGHVCLCNSCAKLLPENKCPICKAPIQYVMKLFLS